MVSAFSASELLAVVVRGKLLRRMLFWAIGTDLKISVAQRREVKALLPHSKIEDVMSHNRFSSKCPTPLAPAAHNAGFPLISPLLCTCLTQLLKEFSEVTETIKPGIQHLLCSRS